MAELKKLTILHSNDMHGDFLAEKVDEKLIGGVSMLSGYINKVRREEKNVLYCIAGDMFRGSVIDSEFQGLSTIEIMNMLSPDVVTIGNHETDYGVAHLLFIEKCARFPIINANLHIKTNHARLFKPCEIIEIDGMKILFIGILTEEVISQTKNDGIIGSVVNIEDAATEIAKICNAYNAIDIDLTVLLTHIGFEEDKKLAATLDPALGVDIIIGGHSHTFIEEPAKVNDILIVQAGTGTDQVGRFDITVNMDTNSVEEFKWRYIPISPESCPADHMLEELITSYKNETDSKYNRVITRFSDTFTHPKREQETVLGDLIADILKDSLGLDIMLVGSGSIRTEELGPVVMLSNLIECFPYDGPIYLVCVTGNQIREMIRYMVRDAVWRGEHCSFFQISHGFEIEYNRADHSFSKFLLNGEELEDDRMYTLGLQEFHYINFEEGFGFPLSEVKKNRKPRKISTSSREILVEYMEDQSIINPHSGNRLKVNL